jgi:hypothetical protein
MKVEYDGAGHTVEALLANIDGVEEGAAYFDMWLPTQLTLRGAVVSTDIAMAVVLDKLLANGFTPAGFTQGVNGRTYHYRRTNSN